MKLLAVQVYVAVEFGERRTKYNYFSSRNELEGLEMELLDGNTLVSIKRGEFHIIIPTANVSHMVPASEQGKKMNVKREAKMGEPVLEASAHPKFQGK